MCSYHGDLSRLQKRGRDTEKELEKQRARKQDAGLTNVLSGSFSQSPDIKIHHLSMKAVLAHEWPQCWGGFWGDRVYLGENSKI